MELVSKSAISRVASIVVVILIILVAFGGYAFGSFNQKPTLSHTETVYSTQTVPTTRTLIITNTNGTTLTVFVTNASSPSTLKITTSSNGKLVTLTEYVVTEYCCETTYVLYSVSSVSYTCVVGTLAYHIVTISTSFVPYELNTTGTFSATVTTISTQTNVSPSITTVTESFPLTTYVTSSNGSTTTITTCSAES